MAKLNHQDDLISKEGVDFRRLRRTLEDEGTIILENDNADSWFLLLEAASIGILGLLALLSESPVPGTVL